ncbi:MAG: OmcA/MtrC family decaheme c-type cytochrome [Gammaproteobacteria bacterium]|nr:OmcA/MtrC family decaheme c-type cytochrome [Gammaproteobacteria bacterium]
MAFLLATAVALLLTGCDGDTGPAGPPGPQGPAGPAGPPAAVNVADAEVINATIDGVSIGAATTVDFTLTDERGNGLVGLQKSNIRFTVAKLEDGVNGDPSAWQSYLNEIETAGSAGPGTEDKLQATYERNAPNAVLDDFDNGSYRYTFEADITNITQPVPVTYDDSLTHRVSFQISGGGLRPVDPSYTFRPSDGAMTGIFTRRISDEASCNNCHTVLEVHGFRRSLDYCVTCHNPGSADANSGNTVDMTVMIHKIHRGANLPSIVGGMDGDRYSIFGRFDEEHIYAINDMGEAKGVIHPQDIRNCRNCHDDTNPDLNTPDARNWVSKPTEQACGACHDTVNFATGENHFMGAPPVTNAECQNCHGDGQFAAADAVHRLLEQEAAENYEYRIIDVTDTGQNENPVVRFEVVNPTTGDPYDIKNDAPFTQPFGASRLAINFAWNTIDYTNVDSGSEVPVQRLPFLPPAGSQAQPLSVNALTNSVDNMDGTYTVTSPLPVSANTDGTLSVAIEGHPGEDVNNDGSAESLPVTTALAYFQIDDDPDPIERREVVSLALCNNCHQQVSLHGSNRNDNIPQCVTCHNADATDIQARTEAMVDANTSLDGKDEESVDFKHMIHAIHAGEVVIHGFAASVHDYREVVYSGRLNDCTGCHVGDTYYPVNQNFVLATTIDTGADLGDPTDDVNISPNASACYGCHRSAAAVSHMQLNGASFNATQAADGTITDNDTMGVVIESCEVCHAEGRSSDTGVIHGIN